MRIDVARHFGHNLAYLSNLREPSITNGTMTDSNSLNTEHILVISSSIFVTALFMSLIVSLIRNYCSGVCQVREHHGHNPQIDVFEVPPPYPETSPQIENFQVPPKYPEPPLYNPRVLSAEV